MGALADKLAGKTSMFGKTYNTIGSADSNFIIKTKGDLKIQWGNKYIDLIKNGKIASEGNKILFIVNSSDEIKDNGIYLVPEQESYEIWVSIDGVKIKISQGETMCVSFLTQQETTQDQKKQALTNLGFYYNTIQDVTTAQLTKGIVYVEETNKLYLVQNGNLQEYQINVSNQTIVQNSENKEEVKIEDIKINGLSLELSINKIPFVTISNENINIHKPLILNSNIQSNDYNDTKGFSITNNTTGSVLNIDRVNIRSIKNSTQIGEVIENNIRELQYCPEIPEPRPTSGIYSNNFIGLNSILYDVVFKKRCGYPKYEMELPESDIDSVQYDQVIPNILWMKKLMDILIPKGTIVMWSGSEIPEGWAICNGENNTPNLIGKFIKASDTANETGGNNSITISKDNLPNHKHSIDDVNTEEAGTHTHQITGTVTYNTYEWEEVPDYMLIHYNAIGNINNTITISSGIDTNIDITVDESIDYELTGIDDGTTVQVSIKNSSKLITFTYKKGTEITIDVYTEDIEINNESPIKTLYPNPTIINSQDIHNGQYYLNPVLKTIDTESENNELVFNNDQQGNHQHSIFFDSTGDIIDSNNTSIDIIPEYYSLIFIMKI